MRLLKLLVRLAFKLFAGLVLGVWVSALARGLYLAAFQPEVFGMQTAAEMPLGMLDMFSVITVAVMSVPLLVVGLAGLARLYDWAHE